MFGTPNREHDVAANRSSLSESSRIEDARSIDEEYVPYTFENESCKRVS